MQQRAVGAHDELGGGEPGDPFGDAGGGAAGADLAELGGRRRDARDRALRDVARLLLVALDGEQRELVAAVARGDVVGAGRAAQRVADAAQHLVADQVAVVLVDLLEVVEVEEKSVRGCGRARARRARSPAALVQRRVVEALR